MRILIVITLLVAGALADWNRTDTHVPPTLLITSDFGSVRRCKTAEEVIAVARIMISAKPDIMALDATANGLVNYKSTIGFLIPGGNFDALLEAGLEPFRMMVDTLRTHGITVLANVRMNDHHGRPEQWTPWERAHTEWSLAKDTGARDWKSIGALRHMDYAIEGVRNYRFSILEEILREFDVDGLQLDFGRTAPFLSEPKGENARLMTEYVRRIRHLLDTTARTRQREKMLLGVLVPWDLDFCTQEGLQVQAWIEQELIDYVSPGEWYYADWNIPLDRWRAITQGSHCKLYPFTPGNVSPYQEFEYGEPSLLGDNKILDPPKLRALADNLISQNPDGFALYNFYTFDFGAYYPHLRTWTDPQQTTQMSKHYLYCRRLMYHANERETFDTGVAFERPLLERVGDRVELPFRFSTRTADVRTTLRCVFNHMSENENIIVRVNGSIVSPETLRSKSAQPGSTAGSDVRVWESVILSPPLRTGDNIIEWELTKREGRRPDGIAVGEFEILVDPDVADPG